MISREIFIMARVTAIGQIRTKHIGYKKGETLRLVRRYMVIHLVDQSKIEIVAFLFNNEIEEFSERLQEGIVYKISNFRTRLCNPEFASDVFHGCQLVFKKNTQICVVPQQIQSIPRWESAFSFTPIIDILNLDDGDTVGRL